MELVLFYGYGAHRELHSFPTRRSSDLPPAPRAWPWCRRCTTTACCAPRRCSCATGGRARTAWARARRGRRCCTAVRSEEHTSELQSRQYLVCRLLLEKRKTQHATYLTA